MARAVLSAAIHKAKAQATPSVGTNRGVMGVNLSKAESAVQPTFHRRCNDIRTDGCPADGVEGWTVCRALQGESWQRLAAFRAIESTCCCRCSPWPAPAPVSRRIVKYGSTRCIGNATRARDRSDTGRSPPPLCRRFSTWDVRRAAPAGHGGASLKAVLRIRSGTARQTVRARRTHGE